jgi:hypothetical protein
VGGWPLLQKDLHNAFRRVDQNADHSFSSFQARIRNRVANCEMVDDLS